MMTKGHYSVKSYVELKFLFSAYCLVMVYIFIKFSINILSALRVVKRRGFQQ